MYATYGRATHVRPALKNKSKKECFCLMCRSWFARRAVSYLLQIEEESNEAEKGRPLSCRGMGLQVAGR